MMSKNILALGKSIDEYRQSMYKAAKEKGFSDPYVVQISQNLDKKNHYVAKKYI